MEQYDIIIIGGGMAGLSAALYGGWLGRKVFLAERQIFGGQIVNADHIENFPGFPDGILGADLVSQVRTQVMKFGAKMAYLEITSLAIRDDRFALQSAKDAYEAKTVIVATGERPRLLGIKGESEFEGRGLSRCATCDGAFFAGKPVAVIGAGDTALDEALYLANIASKVSIIHKGEAPIASGTLVKRARDRPNIEFLANTTVEEIVGKDSVGELRFIGGSKFPVAGVFLAIGYEPESMLLKDLVELDPMGHVPVDLQMRTSVPGLFAVGSARQESAGQLASVAGDGVTAAISAHRYLINKAAPKL
jgi:thioredoxin reductase (NADPH)